MNPNHLRQNNQFLTQSTPFIGKVEEIVIYFIPLFLGIIAPSSGPHNTGTTRYKSFKILKQTKFS